VLALELGGTGVSFDAHSITTGRKRGRVFRGGWDSYGKLLRDLIHWMKQDQNTDSWFSTMIDLYALPNDFPGYDLCKAFADPGKRVECLEKELARDVTKQLGDVAVSQRFIPYIQLYEFESLLFSSPAEFLGAFPEENQAIERLLEIRRQCGGPEDIDDGADSAPSKRILQLLPDYVKTVSGILIAKRIGLAAIRRECPHFNRWIARLLEVAASDPS
jgi:hypothetical protein